VWLDDTGSPRIAASGDQGLRKRVAAGGEREASPKEVRELPLAPSCKPDSMAPRLLLRPQPIDTTTRSLPATAAPRRHRPGVPPRL
jgi:hypothetical protein